MFGGNIKVHFAGTEDENDAVATTVGGVNNSLFTAYPFVAKKTKLKKKPVSLRIIEEHHKHTIMDSGLFTLMFGAQAGKKDAAFIERWFESLCEFVEEIGVKATCVEVDCQKVLGVDAAWSFRKRMKDRLKNRQINVFHLEDGKAGFDRLIEFSDYIAISVPEIRIAHRKTFREDVLRFASYAKNKKPEIDIHLLGCTDPDLLRSCRFCTSSDSTSWCTPRFSWRYLGRNGRSFKSERTERFGTGGEPLLQFDVVKEIIDDFPDAEINVETNGSVDFSDLLHIDNVFVCADYKTPSSGMAARMCPDEYFQQLRPQDSVKFVCATSDIPFACRVVRRLDAVPASNGAKLKTGGLRAHVLFSPVFGKCDLLKLVEAVKRLGKEGHDVRLSLQAHKIVWAPNRRGV